MRHDDTGLLGEAKILIRCQNFHRMPEAEAALMALGGSHAVMFELQADAYRT